MTTGHATTDFSILLVLGWLQILAQLLPAILGLGSGLLGGGDQNATEDGLPVQLDTQFPSLTGDFIDWLGSNLYRTDNGTFGAWGNEAFPGPERTPYSGSAQGPGVDTIGQLTPDINSTILPQVYASWQPWDAGTQYLADQLYNKNQLGTEDPRTKQMMQFGGFGGPGHSGLSTALQYGVPSEAGRYLANLAQFGVTSQPMADFMRAATSGGLNPYRKVPVPPRSA